MHRVRQLCKCLPCRRTSSVSIKEHKIEACLYDTLLFTTKLGEEMNDKLLKDGISALSGSIDQKQVQQFMTYASLLREWNEKMNLTAVTDPDGIAIKHFLDSILPLYHIDFSKIDTIADIGTGAGFPGLPIKIMMPEKKLVLVDSLNKRINFLNHVAEELNLNHITCIHGRAEELGHKRELRESFDAVVSRAVANMTVLCEYCLPFVKVGGCFIALKSDNADGELSDAKAMIGSLGGTVEDVISAPLPMSDITRKLILIRKTGETDKKFPRRADKIKKANKKI